jgi:putative isomerase
MDNAVRFDDATLLQNGEAAWSMDQESVDLNCYLYQEKIELIVMAKLLGRFPLAQPLQQEALKLHLQIQRSMFDKSAGYFFDLRLTSRTSVRDFGPEGWIPLWTGVATPQQARSVLTVLMDPHKFNTTFPFPTLAADDPRFAPTKGYWRGPVWMDQAEFAVEGMERYGFAREAKSMRQKLLANAQGLTDSQPFFENYDPNTGLGQNSRNFSWSAAHYFLLLHPSSEIRSPQRDSSQ